MGRKGTGEQVDRDDLVRFMDLYLEAARIDDASENGLQVEGRGRVRRVVVGVSAHLELIERAARLKADMIIVHHGILWKGQSTRVRGVHGQRIRALLHHDMSLVAYHLPLDMHPEIGNNAQIAKKLQLEEVVPFGLYKRQTIGFAGSLSAPTPFDRFLATVQRVFDSKPTVCAEGPDVVRRIGIVSGGAAAEVAEAIEKRMDVYLTGHIDEFVPALCREGRIHYVAPGHYNTEKFGVEALGKLLTERYAVEVEFLDVPNPY